MRIRPRDFWAMSLVEWRAAVAGRMKRRANALTRGELERLMKDHPDAR